MGNLAVWGGIAGAGKGMQQNVEHQREMEKQAEQFELDTARDERLARLRASLEEQAAGRKQEFEAGQAEAKAAREKEAAEFKEGQHMERTELEIAGRKEVAEIGAGARIASAKERAGTTKKWQAKTLTVAEANEEFPMLQIEKDTPALFHEDHGWMVQKGNKYIRPGMEGEVTAPNVALAALREQPELVEQFMEKYGYIPAWAKKYL